MLASCVLLVYGPHEGSVADPKRVLCRPKVWLRLGDWTLVEALNNAHKPLTPIVRTFLAPFMNIFWLMLWLGSLCAPFHDLSSEVGVSSKSDGWKMLWINSFEAAFLRDNNHKVSYFVYFQKTTGQTLKSSEFNGGSRKANIIVQWYLIKAQQKLSECASSESPAAACGACFDTRKR